ncbi:MAG: translation elongation factor Ts [Nitrospinae bacterium]|nr:translation elongation factor Ts [Nitrospinota bacterium]
MAVTAEMVRDLRDRSGAGIMDCKEALRESNGDMDGAMDYLRKKGLSKAAKKAGRDASEGCVSSYIHSGGKIGVLMEVNCETDFVARNELFQNLVKDVAMHIAAVNPGYLSPEDVPSAELEKEKAILAEQAKESGKPEAVIPKIVEGRLAKFYEERCLLKQKFVKDPDVSIEDLIKAKISELGENIVIRRFTRYQLGGN